MILWKESAERPTLAAVAAVKHAVVATAGVAAILISVLYYHARIRPDLRRAAGEIELTRLRQDVNGDSVYGPAAGPGNAAAHYIRAVNSYSARRIPYMKNRGYRTYVSEPEVSQQEIADLELGTKRRVCDFYEEVNQKPRFKYSHPGKTSWSFRPALSPDEERPYYTPFRLLLMSLTYRAERLKKAGKPADALRLYGLIARVGAHIRQNPQCLLDSELGLEMEQGALSRIAAIVGSDRTSELPRKIAIYRGSLKELEGKIRRKYKQLDNPEAAALIVEKDLDPVWRIEAAAALRDQSYHHALGFLERRMVRSALERAKRDSNHLVRKAAVRLASSKPRAAKLDNSVPL